MASYFSINPTATTAVVALDVNFRSIVLIANDALVTGNDLHISFNQPLSDNNYLVLKPGESFKNLPIGVNTVYYTSTGTVPFRLFGLNR